MPKTLYAFILRHSKKEQFILLLLAAISYPALYYSYDLPKLIINHIKDVTTHLAMTPEEPYPAQALFGLSFEEIGYLLALCFVYLVLVLINGGFKYYINVFKGRLGERLLRRLRYELYVRVLRFPLPEFKKISGSEIIPMITAEVEPLGGFIGDAYVQPIYQGGLLVVPLAFILIQDPVLGLAAVALYPVQAYFVRRLRRRVLRLSKQRIQIMRKVSDRIGEAVSGIQEIHANDSTAYERADITDRLGTVFGIRFDIYRLKFQAKFLNNSIDKLTPFFFYSLGGYLVFQGSIDIGALVAAIAAQKDLSAPGKELLDFWQQMDDVRVKYDQVVDQFEPTGMLSQETLDAEPDAIAFEGEVAGRNISYAEDGGLKVLDGASFAFPLSERVAVVGDGASGKDALGQLLARLLVPTGGQITVAGRSLADLPESVTGRRIAYVGPSTHLLSASLRDNLLYALKHRPLRPPAIDEAAIKARAAEAARAGNTTFDVLADWVDYEAAGAKDADELKAKAVEVLGLVSMAEDVYRMGLRGTIDPARRSELAGKFLEARAALGKRLAAAEAAGLVESFDEARYNTNATVAENLLFGTPLGPEFSEENLARNAYVLKVLERAGLMDTMHEIGRKVAETMVELFADLPPGHEFFERFSFISSEDLPEFQAILGHLGRGDAGALSGEDRARLLSLPFKLVPARHRLDLIDDAVQRRLIEARVIFARELPENLAGAIEFFDRDKYNTAATLQDNILFGKQVYGQAKGEERVGALMAEVLDSLGLRSSVLEVGLDFAVGIGGGRLSAAQRQKLAIARALLKRPKLLIMNEATALLDNQAQGQIMDNVVARFANGGLVWVLHRASLARYFNRVLVMRAGRVVEQGKFADLDRPGTALHEMLQAE